MGNADRRLCITCRERKDPSCFYRYSYTTGQGKPSIRFESRCLECARQRRRDRYARITARELANGRAYKQANREKVNSRVKEYRTLNSELVRAQRRASEAKRRAVSEDNSATGALFLQVLEEARFGERYLDAYSGELIENPTVDHIVPLSKGGAHDYWNLCVTSRTNNTSKHTRSLLEWLCDRNRRPQLG